MELLYIQLELLHNHIDFKATWCPLFHIIGIECFEWNNRIIIIQFDSDAA